jgi:hypothetical protein
MAPFLRQLRPLKFLLFLCLGLTSTSVAQDATSQQIYMLSGSVVNSATGEPVAHALVRTNGTVQRNTFTDNEGHFQIDGMPQGQVTVMAQKPGFFTDQDPAGEGSRWVSIGPGVSPVTVKLVPQSAISGKIMDSAGQPIEHMPVRLTARAVREGRRPWEPRGMAETDEDGHYRFAGLMPGIYYVSAGPREGELELAGEKEKQKSGFPHVYYPGASDLSSAAPIQLAAGQQAQADISVGAVPVYKVTGMIAGHLQEQGVGFQVFTPAGDEISLPTTFNMETGVFTLDNVPAGSYVLRALSQSGVQPLRAEERINVTSNVDGLHLTLAPAVSIPVVVRMDSRNSPGAGSTSANQQRSPVFVHLVPAGMAMSESFSSYEPGAGMTLQNVDFGTYTVEVKSHAPWYVQSATYGHTNVLYDDISVAPGQSYPMEIILRDDGATLSGNVKSPDGTPVHATVVVVPQPLSKQGPQISHGITNTFNISGLAPGEYLVFAFDQIDGLDLSSQDVIESYASQAAQITLAASQKIQVQLDLIHVGKGE